MENKNLISFKTDVIKYIESFKDEMIYSFPMYFKCNSIKRITIQKKDGEDILEGPICVIEGDTISLSIRNLNGEQIYLNYADLGFPIHVLQRQLLFHILHLDCFQNEIKINCILDRFEFINHSFFEDNNGTISYDFTNEYLPIPKNASYKYGLEIHENDKTYYIGMNYDLSIWIQYHDVHNKHQTIPISENCIFRSSDRAIMYDDSNPLFPKVCVLGEKMDWLPQQWQNILPSSIEKAKSKEIFDSIIEIITSSRYTYKCIIDTDGEIIKGF